MASDKIDYHKLVDYDVADPAKILAQKEGLATSDNFPFGFLEVPGTRGESAYVFDMGDMYGALVQEGLGTKSLITQSIYAQTGKSYFAEIAQDTVATFVNDLVSVGATPVVTNAYWSSSSYDWLADNKVIDDFIKGWRAACDKARIVWGGGETQSLPGVIEDGRLELAGCAFGVIKDRKRLIRDRNLQAGDSILLIEASGVHANGISLAREIASNLEKGYQTKLPSGIEFGEALSTPTTIYAQAIKSLFEANLDIHYLSNITGHGWRKIMRADAEFTYEMNEVPPKSELFSFIAEKSGNSEEEMYANYNMGAGYAVYLPEEDAIRAQALLNGLELRSWLAGTVKSGPKQVIIKPKNIVFAASSLGVRA